MAFIPACIPGQRRGPGVTSRGAFGSHSALSLVRSLGSGWACASRGASGAAGLRLTT